MSHAVVEYDHPIEHHVPQEGFDHTEPNTPAIWLFTVASIIGLILVIVAVQGYFDQIYKEAVYDRVLSVPSEAAAGRSQSRCLELDSLYVREPG